MIDGTDIPGGDLNYMEVEVPGRPKYESTLTTASTGAPMVIDASQKRKRKPWIYKEDHDRELKWWIRMTIVGWTLFFLASTAGIIFELIN